MKMTARTEITFNNILDTMSGGDNGKFVSYMIFIKEMDKRAINGDKDAKALLDIMYKFSKLIDTAYNLQHEQGDATN